MVPNSAGRSLILKLGKWLPSNAVGIHWVKWRSKVRGQGSEVKGQLSKVKGQRSWVKCRGQGENIRAQMSEVKGQRWEVNGQRLRVKWQRSRVKVQGSMVKGQGSKVKGQRSRPRVNGPKWNADGSVAGILGRQLCSSAAAGLVRCNGANMHQVSVQLPVSEVKLKPAYWDGALIEHHFMLFYL